MSISGVRCLSLPATPDYPEHFPGFFLTWRKGQSIQGLAAGGDMPVCSYVEGPWSFSRAAAAGADGGGRSAAGDPRDSRP